MADDIRQQHALYYSALAEEADPHLRGHQQQLWHARVEADLDNMRVALQWWMDRGDLELGLRLIGALGWFWYQHSNLAEGRAWCESLLGQSPPAPGSREYIVARVRALFAGGVLAVQQGNFAQARAWHEEGLRLARDANDAWGVAWSIQGLGHTFARTSQTAVAREYLHESLALWRRLGHRWGEAFSLNWLGNAAYEDGDLDTADKLYHQALDIRREVGDMFSSANTLEYLGRIQHARGNYATARELFAESLTLHRGIGDRQGGQGVARAQLSLGRLACAEHKHVEAAVLLSAALRLFRRVSDRVGTIGALEATAMLATERRHMAQATRLFGAANTLREGMDHPPAASEGAEREASLSAIRSDLTDEAFHASWDAGAVLDLGACVKCAEEELNEAASSAFG